MQYNCKKCKATNNRDIVLNSHREDQHTKTKFVCYECNYEVTSKSELERHMNTVHAKSENKEECTKKCK